VAAADIEALHPDTGRLRERAPRIGGVRYAGELLALQVRADFRRRDVNHRRGARDDDVLGQPADLHLCVDGDGLAEDDLNVLAHVLPESLQLEHELVRPRWKRREQVPAVGFGDRRACPDERG
jgi:hypothetical protein